MDVRRNANLLYGGKMLRGPLKIFDTTPALIGGLFAEKHGLLKEYSTKVFAGFLNGNLQPTTQKLLLKSYRNLDYLQIITKNTCLVTVLMHMSNHMKKPLKTKIFGVPPCLSLTGSSFGAMIGFGCWSSFERSWIRKKLSNQREWIGFELVFV